MKRISRFHFNLMLISGFLLFFETTGVQAQGKFVDNEILQEGLRIPSTRKLTDVTTPLPFPESV